VDDGIGRSIVDVKLVSYISGSNLSVLLNQSICEVVRWPKWSTSTIFWNFSTHRCMFLCSIQFSLYCVNILLFVLEGFTSCDHKNQMRACSSTMVQSERGANLFTL